MGVWQDKAQRQQDTPSGLRHPYIYPWISCTDCIDSQTEVSRNIRQRIPLFKSDDRQRANDVIFFCNKKVISFDLFLQVAWKRQRFNQNFSHISTAMERKDEHQ